MDGCILRLLLIELTGIFNSKITEKPLVCWFGSTFLPVIKKKYFLLSRKLSVNLLENYELYEIRESKYKAYMFHYKWLDGN